MSKILGDRGERLAADFMVRNGYEIIERNFRFQHAEIDLIARRGNLVVFCEVKTRKSDAFGAGEEAVDSRKMEQIRRAAEGFVSRNGLDDLEFRFDVIVVDVRHSTTTIRAIEDAF